jgi:hypothetical protein
MPCWELFEAQDPDDRDQVLPPRITARLAVEAGSTALARDWQEKGEPRRLRDRDQAHPSGAARLTEAAVIHRTWSRANTCDGAGQEDAGNAYGISSVLVAPRSH